MGPWAGSGHPVPNEFHDLGVCRKAPRPVLREDHLPVDGDIEDSPVALDQPGPHTQPVDQLGFQTGSLRLVVSAYAVDNGHVHRKDPPFADSGCGLLFRMVPQSVSAPVHRVHEVHLARLFL